MLTNWVDCNDYTLILMTESSKQNSRLQALTLILCNLLHPDIWKSTTLLSSWGGHLVANRQCKAWLHLNCTYSFSHNQLTLISFPTPPLPLLTIHTVLNWQPLFQSRLDGFTLNILILRIMPYAMPLNGVSIFRHLQFKSICPLLLLLPVITGRDQCHMERTRSVWKRGDIPMLHF